MISRASLGRNVSLNLRPRCGSQAILRRGLASPASGSFTYETGEANGVKYASRDLPGATSNVAVVARAGTRYQPLPGFSEGLEKFAFKGTERRSALRITRESELLGGELSAYHTRENLVLGSKFLKEDLPYFVELLGGYVLTETAHEFNEEVLPSIQLSQRLILEDTEALALDYAHSLAFHRGLGTPIHPNSASPMTKYLNADYLAQFSQVAYNRANIAVIGNGVDGAEFSKWVKEFFSDVPSTLPSGVAPIEHTQAKYYGGEQRVYHPGSSTMILAFPGTSAFTGAFWKPELAVLASLLGGKSTIKWSPGFSLLAKATEEIPGAHIETKNIVYSDAGLLCISINGSAAAIKAASKEVVKTVKNIAAGQISKEDTQKAVANAKFDTLNSGQDINTGIELSGSGIIQGGKPLQIDQLAKSIEKVTETQLKAAAKNLLESKATVSSVGDLFMLPYAEELGLKV